jgi:aspartyl-tRNA(Asn)/glutamyl-tRNA(Gln) amidotransferase subunit B
MTTNSYEPVIGLEVHAELLTKSKMFCGCAVVDSTQAEPNTLTCPVCTAMPGVLPVINKRAVEFAIMTALALHCTVQSQNVFARKNYFYPDLPKGYQISQYDMPLATNGCLEIESAKGRKRIGVRRVHLEEDTGKLAHVPGASLIDYNRAGVPLMEIVSEPDMHSVDELRLYAEGLRAILRYLGVNNGDMEKGVIRFEANISVRRAGSTELSTRTEIKNLNSFRALVRGAEYEIARQSALWARGEQVVQQTMGWDEARGVTVPQRSKEQAHDYRYFPEPDLPPLVIAAEWVEAIRVQLPELPDMKRARFETEFGLSPYDADLLTREKAVAHYYEDAVAAGSRAPAGGSSQDFRTAAVPPRPDGVPATGSRAPAGDHKAIANWILGELYRLMKEQGIGIESVKIPPTHLGQLSVLVTNGTLSSTLAKEVFGEMFATGSAPAQIVKAKGLAQISDSAQLQAIIAQVIRDNPKPVADYLAGKVAVIKFLVGQVMRATRGKAHPQLVGDFMEQALDAQRSSPA